MPPGAGTLIVGCASIDHVLKQVNRTLLRTGKLDPSGDSTGIFGYQSILAPEGVTELPVQLSVERGVTVEGTISDADGSTPEIVRMPYVGLLTQFSDVANTRPRVLIYDGKLSVHGIPPEGERTVWLLDAENKQGKVLHVRANDANQPLNIALEKCGSVSRRYVDAKQNPVAGYRPEFVAVQMSFLPEDSFQGKTSNDQFVNFNAIIVDLFEDRNGSNVMSDENGRLTYPALIPGAIYGWSSFPFPSDRPWNLKVAAGEHLDLPDVVITNPEDISKAAKQWAKSQEKNAAPAGANQ